MQYLREGSATIVQLGPFLDKSDALTEETALEDILGVEISKNGAPFTNRQSGSGITHDTEGWYRVPLSTIDTELPGRLVVRAQDPTTHLPVWKEFFIVSCDYWDTVFEAGGCTDCDDSDCVWTYSECADEIAACTQYIVDFSGVCAGTWTYGFGDNVSATATITFTGVQVTDGSETITIISTDGTSVTYTAWPSSDFLAGSNQFKADVDAADSAAKLKLAIDNAGGHDGKITVADNGSGVLTLTQATIGTAGNTAITESLSNCTVTAFTGGSAHKTTAALDWNASCDEVVTAIEGLSTVSSSCITSCTKDGNSTWLFCTDCDLSDGVITNVDLVSCDGVAPPDTNTQNVVPGGDAVPLTAGTPTSPVLITENPFGAHSATGKTDEANELNADRRMVIDYDRDMKNLSDANLKLKVEEIDQLFVDHNGEFVITFVSSFARDTDVNKYTLPAGADLTAYLALVTNIVKRYSAHNGWGDNTYKSGAFSAPSSAAQTAITASPVKSWQVENEWDWQIFTSTAYTTNVSVATVGGHLSSMHATITTADDSTAGSRIIFAARPSQAAVATATDAAGTLVAAGADGSTAATRLGRFADSDGTTSDVIITGDTDCTFASKLTSALTGSELNAATTSRDATANLLLNYEQYYDIVDIHSYGAAHSTPTGASGPSDESSPHRLAKHTADWITAIFNDPGAVYPASFTAADKITGKEFWSMESAAPFFFFPMMPEATQPTTCTSDSDFAYSERIHSLYVPKVYAQNLASGIKRTFYSALTPDTTYNNNYQRLALTDTVGRFGAGSLGKKPAYYTYKVLSDKLGSINKVEEVPLSYGTGHDSLGQSAELEATVIKCSLPGNAASTATISFSGAQVTDGSEQITIISTDGTSVTYTAWLSSDFLSGSNQFKADVDAADSADKLKLAIEHAGGHGGKITVVDNGSGTLTLTQATVGVAGNSGITENLSNCTVTSFAGGTQLDPIYIAWSQNATVKSLDLSTELGIGSVTLTHVLTEIDDDIPDVTIASTSNIALTAYPVLIQTSSGQAIDCDAWHLTTPCPGECVCDPPTTDGISDGQQSTVECRVDTSDPAACPATPLFLPTDRTWAPLCDAIADIDAGCGPQEVTFLVSFIREGTEIHVCKSQECPDCSGPGDGGPTEAAELRDYGGYDTGTSPTVTNVQFMAEVVAALDEWKTFFETVFPDLTLNIENLGLEDHGAIDWWNCVSENFYAVPGTHRVGDIRIGMYPFLDDDGEPEQGASLAYCLLPGQEGSGDGTRDNSQGDCNSCGSIRGDLFFDQNENWRTDLGGEGDAYSIKYVAAHELGHAFGLRHAEGDSTALMFTSAGTSTTFELRFPDGIAGSLTDRCALVAAYETCGVTGTCPDPTDPNDPPCDPDFDDECPPDPDPDPDPGVCGLTSGTAGVQVTLADLTITNQIANGTGNWGYLTCDQISDTTRPAHQHGVNDPIFKSDIRRITPDQECKVGARAPCGTSHTGPVSEGGQALNPWELYKAWAPEQKTYHVTDRVQQMYPVQLAWNVDGTLLQLRDTNVWWEPGARRHPWDYNYGIGYSAGCPSGADPDCGSGTHRFVIYDGGAKFSNGVAASDRVSGKTLIETSAPAWQASKQRPLGDAYEPLMITLLDGANNFWSMNPATRQHAYNVVDNRNFVTYYKNQQNAGKASSGDTTKTGYQFVSEFQLPFFTMLTGKLTPTFPAKYKNASDGLTFKHGGRGTCATCTPVDGGAITSVTTGSTTLTVTTVSGHGLAIGHTVVIFDVEGQTGANGTWVVTDVTDNTFEIEVDVDAGTHVGGTGDWYQQVTVAENTYVAMMGNRWHTINDTSNATKLTDLTATQNPDYIVGNQSAHKPEKHGQAIQGIEPWLYIVNMDYDAATTTTPGPVVAAINLTGNSTYGAGWASHQTSGQVLSTEGEQYLSNGVFVGASTNSVRFSRDGRYIAVRYQDGVFSGATSKDSWRFFEVDMLAYTTDPADQGSAEVGATLYGTEFNITPVNTSPTNSASVSMADGNTDVANGSLNHGHFPIIDFQHPSFACSKATTAQSHFGDTIQKPNEFFIGGTPDSNRGDLATVHGKSLAEVDTGYSISGTDGAVDKWGLVTVDNPCGWIGRMIAADLTTISASKYSHPTLSPITAVTNASPIVITSTAHGLANGQEIIVSAVGGNTNANGTHTVANITADTFELDGSTGNAAYTSGTGIWVTSENSMRSLDNPGGPRSHNKTDQYSAYPSYAVAPPGDHPAAVISNAAYVYVSYGSAYRQKITDPDDAAGVITDPDLPSGVKLGEGGLFAGEIVAFNLDNPNVGMVRIAHHRTATNTFYDTSPRIQVHPDGTKLLVSSTWSGLATPCNANDGVCFPDCAGNESAKNYNARWAGNERTESYIIDLVQSGLIQQPEDSSNVSTIGGGVNALSLTAGGSGYTHAPKVTVEDGHGRCSAAAAIIYNGSVVAITLLDGGSGYATAPIITISGGDGAGATATAAISGPGCPSQDYLPAKWIWEPPPLTGADHGPLAAVTLTGGNWRLATPCCTASGLQGVTSAPTVNGSDTPTGTPQVTYTDCSVPPDGLTISPAGVDSAEDFGSTWVPIPSGGGLSIAPPSVGSGEAIPGGTTAGGGVTISPVGVASDEDVPTGAELADPLECDVSCSCGCASFMWTGISYTLTSNDCTGACGPPTPPASNVGANIVRCCE
jgi:hypothetical protein